MDEYASLQGTLSGGSQNLLRAFLLSDTLDMLSYKVYRYPGLASALDQRDNEIAARFQQVQLLFARFGTATAWFTPELLSIPWETMEKWLNETEELAPYRYGIENTYRQQAHVLSEDQERLLSYFGPFNGAPVTAYSNLTTADINYQPAVLSSGDTVTMSPGQYYFTLSSNRNQADRAKAFEAHYETYHTNRNTYAALYNSVLQRDWALAQARNYNSCLEATLDEDNVPVEVYETLVKTVADNAEPLHRYFELRKQILGLETYHNYDGNIPIVDFDKVYEYDDVIDWVIESVKPLGSEYQSMVREALNNRWVDVYETEGKTTGAFSASVYGVHPYLLLNYNKTLSSVFTLAHEIAHCMHTQLSDMNQPKATADYTLFVAEVASAINEALLLEYLLEHTSDPVERIAVLQQAIQDLEGTFCVQAMFAAYEMEAHKLVEQGQPITADILSDLYSGLLKRQIGEGVVFDSLYGSTWTRISHFYEVPYYVYKYATCYASAAHLMKEVTSGDPKVRQDALERYMTLLKSGGNDYPMEQLKKAGVDLANPDTFQAVIDQLDGLVTRLETEMARL
jgi:oligoendopeptidase F